MVFYCSRLMVGQTSGDHRNEVYNGMTTTCIVTFVTHIGECWNHLFSLVTTSVVLELSHENLLNLLLEHLSMLLLLG